MAGQNADTAAPEPPGSPKSTTEVAAMDPASAPAVPVPDGDTAESGSATAPPEPVADVTMFELQVQLPTKGAAALALPLLSTDCVQDMRQYVSDHPSACTNTCFYFEYKGERLNNMTEIGAIEGLASGDTVAVKNDLYNERAVSIHLRRLRDLLRAMSGTTDREGVSLTGEQYPPTYLPHVLSGKFGDPMAMGMDLQTIYAAPPPSESDEGAAAGAAISDISLSCWNPPPGPRALKGDLAYVRVQTAKGAIAHFVAHTRGFYLSRTTDTSFDPTEHSEHSCRSHTLSGSLEQYCPIFKSRMSGHVEAQRDRNLLEVLPAPYGVSVWMTSHEPHTADKVRAQDAEARWSESDPLNPGMLRDWNDELQTLRDLECATESDRLLRDRALFKLHTDYVAAATKGAQAAVLGNIPAVNPVDPPETHMFVWNNMFLSFATNSRGIFTELGGEEAAHAAANNDLRGVRAFSSIRNSGLYLLATVLVDYLGRRVVAQSIIPGILRKNHPNTIVYGSNDIEEKMVVDPAFSSVLKGCSPALFVDEHKVKYKDGEVHTLHSSSECKGIAGIDGRFYVLDLIRTTPIDTNFAASQHLDAEDVKRRGAPVHIGADDASAKATDTWEPRHKLCVLRPELLMCYRGHIASERSQALKDAGDSDGAVVNMDDFRFNIDAFTYVELADSPEKVASDRQAVRAAGQFLLEKVIPLFVAELKTQQVRPLDGQALTDLMHERGINMRYLGRIVAQLDQTASNWRVCFLELVSRAAKAQLRKLMRESDRAQLSDTVSHFFNCLLGKVTSPAGKKKGKGKEKRQHFTSALTSARLWATIAETCKTNFFCVIHQRLLTSTAVDALALLRSVCKKTGVQVVARAYNFSSDSIFRPSDILNIFPTVKHNPPESARGMLLFSEGRRKVANSEIRHALALLEAAIQEMQQVYGLLHPMIADVHRVQAYILSHTTDTSGLPIGYQEKSLLIMERVCGRDHPDVIRGYITLGTYMHTASQSTKALAALTYARQLCLVAAGPSHPEISSIDIRIAMCLIAMGKPEVSLGFLDKILVTQEAVGGDNSVAIAQTSLLRAKALQQTADLRGALAAAREAHSLFSKKFGDSDIRTRDCFAQVNRITAEAVKKERAKNADRRNVKVAVSNRGALPVA